MEDKKNSLRLGGGSLKPFIIAVVAVIIAWVIGKGVLTFISSVKQM